MHNYVVKPIEKIQRARDEIIEIISEGIEDARIALVTYGTVSRCGRAAAVSARLGLSAALITMSAKKIGLMSCNPAIGGLAKGQLVREIDHQDAVLGYQADQRYRADLRIDIP